jgi:N-methylhydantoinase A/oxoprolinase/acetone carboxylase beta subunit
MSSPFDLDSVNALLKELRERGRAELTADGVDPSRHLFSLSIDMRHRGQINEVEVDLLTETLSSADMEGLRERFVERYERLYGRGAALPGARLEIVTFRCRASALSRKPKLIEATQLSDVVDPNAHSGTREIYWAENKQLTSTSIYDGYKLRPGNSLSGPCVVETTTTSMVIHPNQSVSIDALGNFVIDPNAQ